jgi:hypothetical protein
MAQYVACFTPEAHRASASEPARLTSNLPGSQVTWGSQLIDGDKHPVVINTRAFRFPCFRDGADKSQMDDKTYLVRFKESGLSPVLVEAAKVEVHGEHLVFLRAGGELSALFLFENVEDWSEIDR